MDDNNECEDCEVRDTCDMHKDDDTVDITEAITIELHDDFTIGIRATSLDVELLTKMLQAATIVIADSPPDNTDIRVH